MNIRRSFSFALTTLAVLMLAACSTTSPTPDASWTQEAVDQAMEEATSTLTGAASAWGSDAASQALASPAFASFAGFSISPASFSAATIDASTLLDVLVPAATTTLPTGTMTYDSGSGAFVQTSPSPSNDLLLVWTFEHVDPNTMVATSYSAEALFDWNNSGGNDLVSSEPIFVTTASSDQVEVPTAMRMTLEVGPSGGALASAADVEAAISWFEDCLGIAGPIDDVVGLTIDGSVGLDHVLDFDMVSLSIDDAASRLDTSGTISYQGQHAASVTWDVTLHGDVIRNSCYFAGIDVSAGDIEVSVTIEPSGGTARTFTFVASFDSVVTGPYGEVVSANVDGSLSIDGTTAFSFAGTFDDADADGVPGENVTVTYGGGATTTMEDILRSHAPVMIVTP